MPSATQTKLRGDTRTNLNSVTPAAREAAVDTTNNRMNIGDGSRAGGWELPNFRDIQTQAFGYGTAGGTANALTLTLTPALIAYTAGTSIEVKAASNNTTTTTINVNGLGVKTIRKMKSGTLSDLEADDIVSGGIYRMTYDGTYFQIKSLDEAAVTSSGLVLLSVVSGAAGTYDFTSNITTAYENYLIKLQNVLFSVDDVEVYLRVRRSGQGTFDTGASDYGYFSSTIAHSGVGLSGSDSTDDAAAFMEILTNVDSTGGVGVSGDIECFGLGQSVRAQFHWKLCNLYSSSGLQHDAADGWGSRDTTTALDGVRITPASGTIVSGDAYLYGIASSL